MRPIILRGRPTPPTPLGPTHGCADVGLLRSDEQDPLKADLVKLRHFAGLTIDEAAQVLDISTTTANRYWTFARAWLHQEIAGSQLTAGGSAEKFEKNREAVE